MKTYIVYVKGEEQPEYIKATSHNDAEKKAQKRYANVAKAHEISVAYTEI
jgi:hypothetical protein